MIDALAVFLVSALVIGVLGTRLAALADRLAERTGLGEAIVGGAFLGGVTSLSGIVTSVTAAAAGHGELAFSNAVGGIAAQTTFLVIADILYRRANLEHAAASVTNIMQGALLIALLSLPLLAFTVPRPQAAGIHPATLAILLGYVFGVHVTSAAQRAPMWRARTTAETRIDQPNPKQAQGAPLAGLLLRFALFAIAVAVAGYATARSGLAISLESGLSQTLVGAFLTAVATSLPELVTTIAAVRRGALTLAVGGIIGGNSFDVLLVALSDIAYRAGSIYEAVGERQVFLLALSILMTAILLVGLIRRQRRGFANIGFEGSLVLLVYFGGIAVQLARG